MSVLGKIEDWRLKFFLWAGLPLIAVMGLGFSAPDVGPAWSARSDGGTLGQFTAVKEDCGRRSCSFYGDWAAADNSSARTNVILYDEPDGMRVGDKIEARDTGARKGVYTTAGGISYLLVTGLFLAGIAAAIGWVIFLYRRFKARVTPATQSSL